MVLASEVAKRQGNGDGAGSCLNPQGPVYRRNHARDNMRAIRERERQMMVRRTLEIQAQNQPEDLFKLKQFAGARSRVFDAKPPRPASGSRAQPQRPASGSRPPSGARARSMPRQATVSTPRSDEGEVGDPEEMSLEDFEAQVEALKQKHGSEAQQQKSGGRPPPAVKKDADGRPAYLRKIKQDLADEKAAVEAAFRGPDAPPGLRRLPAEEVAETLAGLKAKREEIEKEFRSLPLSIQTESQKRREKAVKAKIEESDKAIAMFSAPVVFVKA